MTAETLRSPSPPANSVIAIGNGWIVPWVMSRRSTALDGRDPRKAAAVAPPAVASSRRRDQKAAIVEFGFALVVMVFLFFGAALQPPPNMSRGSKVTSTSFHTSYLAEGIV